MKREDIIAWDILTRNVDTWIVDKLTWSQTYERGYREPRFPVPAIPLQVRWPQMVIDGVDHEGYADMVYIDDLRWGKDDPWMVRAWDFGDEPHRRFMLYWYNINSNVAETTEF